MITEEYHQAFIERVKQDLFKCREKGCKERTSEIRIGKGNYYRKIPLNQKSKELLLRYNEEMIAKGKNSTSRHGEMMFVRLFALYLKKYKKDKSLLDVKRDDLIDFINYLHAKKISEMTICGYKMRIKVFYEWLEDKVRRKFVDKFGDMMHPAIPIREKTAEQMLTWEDVQRMVLATPDTRNKAVISCLFELGCRISEFVAIKIKDLKFDAYGCLIKVDSIKGKLGKNLRDREVRLVTSVPYLTNWLNIHPDKNNPENHLWVVTAEDQSYNYGKQLHDQGVRLILRNAKKRAGIKKPVNPHNFRHSRISFLALKGVPEQVIKILMGWGANSRQMSTYVHLNSQQADSVTLAYVHKVTKKEIAVPDHSPPKTCRLCGKENPPSNMLCFSCSYPLDANGEEASDFVEQQLSKIIPKDMLNKIVEKAVADAMKEKGS